MTSAQRDHMAGERLLNEYEDEKHSTHQHAGGAASNARFHIAYAAIISCLILSNLGLFFSQRWQPLSRAASSHDQNDPVMGRSQFAGLRYDTPIVYTNHSEYLSADDIVASESWANINTDPLVVALTDEYAAAHNIERSQLRFVWDESKGIYFIKLFHSLHCLKAMHKGFTDMKNGVASEHAQWHFYHCLDSLRQDLLCQADDTPMPLVKLPDSVGYGQTRMCRNYDALVSWTQETERNACYRRFSDSRGVKNKIEMYAFCPEDSPYYDLSNAYFDKWGHLDPYGDDEGQDL